MVSLSQWEPFAPQELPCFPATTIPAAVAMDLRHDWLPTLRTTTGLIRCAHPSRGSPPGALCPLRSHCGQNLFKISAFPLV
jgi:hypothetical protein